MQYAVLHRKFVPVLFHAGNVHFFGGNVDDDGVVFIGGDAFGQFVARLYQIDVGFHPFGTDNVVVVGGQGDGGKYADRHDDELDITQNQAGQGQTCTALAAAFNLTAGDMAENNGQQGEEYRDYPADDAANQAGDGQGIGALYRLGLLLVVLAVV